MEILQLIQGSKVPEPRGGASFIQYDVGKFFLLGGANRNGELNDMWQLCVSYTGSSKMMGLWNKVQLKNQELYTPRSGQAIFITEQKHIYLFGGQTFETGRQTDEFYMIDLANMSLSIVESKNKPKARNSHTLNYYSGKAYLFGGADQSGPFNDLHVFDVESKQWEQESLSGCDVDYREMHTAHIIKKLKEPEQALSHNNKQSIDVNHKVVELDFQIDDQEPIKEVQKLSLNDIHIQQSNPSCVLQEEQKWLETPHLVILGGRFKESLLDSVMIVNLENFDCKTIFKMFPNGLCAHTSIYHTNEIITFGGLTVDGFTGESYVLNILTYQMDKKNLKSTHMQRIAMSSEVFKEKGCVLVFGGSSYQDETNQVVYGQLN